MSLRILTLAHRFSYGGIFELGAREYTLDDFYMLQLDKLERFVCLKPSGIVIPTEAEESSDEEGENEGEESDEDEEDEDDSEGETEEDVQKRKPKGKGKEKEKEKKGRRREVEESEEEPEGQVGADAEEKAEVRTEEGAEAGVGVRKVRRSTMDIFSCSLVQRWDDLQAQATAFMGVSAKDPMRSAEDVVSTPAPGETLATFYARSRTSSLDVPSLTETDLWAQANTGHRRPTMQAITAESNYDGTDLGWPRRDMVSPFRLEFLDFLTTQSPLVSGI